MKNNLFAIVTSPAVWIAMLILAFFGAAGAMAQAVDRVEFFLGEDPGLGEGVEVILGEGEENLSVPVPLDSLTPGIHRVHFRARDTNGTWGLTSSIAVSIPEPEVGFPVAGFEYAIAEAGGEIVEEGEFVQFSGEAPSYTGAFVPAEPLVYLERYALTVFARDILGFRSEASPETSLVTMPPDENWVNQHFTEAEIESGLASFRRDSDGDGALNVQEYAALSDPRSASSSTQQASLVENGFLQLQYEQRTGGSGTPGIDYSVAGISISAQSSLDGLSSWQAGEEVITFVERVSAGRPGVERITVRQNAPIAENDRGFLRVGFRSSP